MIFVNLYVSVILLLVNVYKKSPVNGDGQIKRAATVHNWTGRNIMKQQHNVRPAIRRVLQATAIVTAAALTLAGCSMGAPSSDTGSSDGKLTVWVMQGDQSEATIKAINDQFTKETGVEVNIQNQQWKDISTKITTALSTSTPPDVLDLGNTQVAGFAASGGLMDLTDHADELRQGVTWLSGLEEPATVDGKLYGIPALGAARAVVYNKKTWAAAGINEPPTTYAELEADLQILKARTSPRSMCRVPIGRPPSSGCGTPVATTPCRRTANGSAPCPPRNRCPALSSGVNSSTSGHPKPPARSTPIAPTPASSWPKARSAP